MQKVNFPSFDDHTIDAQFPGILRVSNLEVLQTKNRETLVLQMVVKPDPENEQHSTPYAFSRDAVVYLAEQVNSFLASQ